ncbi:MAG: mmgC2, partial [Polaromonas sp.]|nr:mmgC2 [Polaromonas sp.]
MGFVAEEGGLREGLIALEELGRAACPVPLLGALLANLLLKAQTAQAGVAELLEQLHSGRAALAFSFGVHDGDANAGSVTFMDGKLAFIEDMAVAPHLLGVATPRFTVNSAAPAFDLGQQDRRYYASAANANATPA